MAVGQGRTVDRVHGPTRAGPRRGEMPSVRVRTRQRRGGGGAGRRGPGLGVGRDRGALAVLAAALLVVGVAALVLGWTVQTSPEDRTPVPLAVGEVWTAPERPLFVGDLVVYGTPDGGARPGLDELGCVVTEGGGPLSTSAAAAQDRIVVQGRGLVPLVSYPGQAGYSVACTGPAAAEAAPLFVVPGATSRTLVPLGAYCVAALAVPLGLVGLLMLRAGAR